MFSQKSDRKKNIARFSGLVVVVALTVTFSFVTDRQLQSAADARRDTNELITGANAVLSELKDAETGQRGYVLTGDETCLERYLAVRDTVRGDRQAVRLATSIGAAKNHVD